MIFRNRSLVDTFVLALLAVIVLSSSAIGWTGPVHQAFAESARTGRPLMVVVTRPTCTPCQAMKQRLEADPSLTDLRADFLIVTMDLSDTEFQWISDRYPVPFEIVPMVYVISPSGDLMYAEAGALDVGQLDVLRQATLAATGRPLTEDQIQANTARLEVIRQSAFNSKYTKALRVASDITSQRSSAASVMTAIGYEQRLIDATSAWCDELNDRLANGESIHQTSYLVATLYVTIPEKHRELRNKVGETLRKHQSRSETRSAMLQGKQLVRARIDERRSSKDVAVRSYLKVVSIDPGSPAGQCAAKRARMLKEAAHSLPKKERTELTQR